LVDAVSLGGDTDTRGAVAGLLAGTRWGFAALPVRWVDGCFTGLDTNTTN
jgi:ADP-ribosyl-[dinitrogen reductase] hydrolase